MSIGEPIPPSKRALAEAKNLAGEILQNLELSEMRLTSIALKASHLARLLNDFDMNEIFRYEAGGYPSDEDGVPREIWHLGELAGRTYDESENGKVGHFMELRSIAQLEAEVALAGPALAAATDHDISITSTNPNPYMMPQIGNMYERQRIRNDQSLNSACLAKSRALIHKYASERFYELEFSSIADDVFSRARERVDAMIGSTVPAAVQRVTAAYENLQSDNPADWSNAVHSCRRVLEDLADVIFPATDKVRTRNGREIKLGKGNYINRLVAFAEDRSSSETSAKLIGSHLDFLGDRLDAVFKAAHKGTHATVGREEADRYVVYTYLLVGDLLSLREIARSQASTVTQPST
jgi:AbiTii